MVEMLVVLLNGATGGASIIKYILYVPQVLPGGTNPYGCLLNHKPNISGFLRKAAVIADQSTVSNVA
jgi:hypothetical protein